MGKSDYLLALELLAAAGLEIEDSHFAGTAFGSWHVTVRGIPQRRIVWDGKDARLYVQCVAKSSIGELCRWSDLWTARDASEHSVELAVKHLLEDDR